MSYDAVVFDNDGVLTHPTPREVLRTAARDAYAAFDVDPSERAIEAAVDGGPEDVREVITAEGYDLDHGAFWRRREALAAARQRRAMTTGEKPTYDDVAALEPLAARRPTGVVSNNQHATVEHVLDVHDLADLFGTAYGRPPTLAGYRRRKPEPFYLERALADLSIDTDDDVLFVGDSGVDVAVAARLGIDSAFIRRPHRRGYDLTHSPTHEVTSLREVVALALPDVAFTDDADGDGTGAVGPGAE